MGRVAGSYGVRGWIKVQHPEAALPACSKWWIGGMEYAVEEAKAHSGTLLAKLAGIGSREAALKLKGATVSVRRAALPEAGEGHYYLADLVGLEVVNASGVALGFVKRMFTNGAQDVMEVAGDRTRLLPWVAAVVKRVDLSARRIEVEWQADW
ncbi:MAG TPA: ribosome maturation factor RimM [Burkholderiales bacterium]|nr:ribosome maturation factor RimM [Burkholderiales bacterium]